MSKARAAICCFAATTTAATTLAQADVFIPLGGGVYFPAGLDAGVFYYLLLRAGFAGLLMAARWIDPQAAYLGVDTPYIGEDTGELTTVSS